MNAIFWKVKKTFHLLMDEHAPMGTFLSMTDTADSKREKEMMNNHYYMPFHSDLCMHLGWSQCFVCCILQYI